MRVSSIFVSMFGIALLAACGGGGGGNGGDDNGRPPGSDDYDYVVDNPRGGFDLPGSHSADDGDTGGDGDGDGDSSQEPRDAQEVLLEADIVQLAGDRLYALSEFSGMTIIDAADPDDLAVLGRYRLHATPFEMYLEQDVAFIMYHGYGRHVFDEDEETYSWRTSSYLAAVDASDPGEPVLIGDVELPGRIQDSRRKGDLLYIVTHESGCWGCAEATNTTVTSFDIADLSELAQVDQAVLEIPDIYNEHERSVYSTTERMYIASPAWGEAPQTTVQVLDISDDSGMLAEGASFEVNGEIRSRWQLDEHEGVLRVVSQHPWEQEIPPVIETFTVSSASDITPLGMAEMRLPRPEELRSVRFDGERGYAITFERTDPLFTLDLSDPANPMQIGELEIPGWVYHMVPRGDRVLGLGFDEGNEEGALNASLFDVSDFADPQMISRVHFGGVWADFAESQNRIHKAFVVNDDLGLMLVPFSGWEGDDGCHERFRAGVQLIDLEGDTLTARGLAEQDDRARRALLHADRLLAVSESSVQSFDIDDRDAPAERSRAALAHQVDHIAPVGEYLVRIELGFDNGRFVLDVVPADQPDALVPLGSLDLGEVLETTGKYGGGGEECQAFDFYPQAMLSDDRHFYLIHEVHDEEVQAALQVFDLDDPTSPTHVASLDLTFNINANRLPFDVGGEELAAARVGSFLVLHTSDQDWPDGDGPPVSTASFQLIDVSDPSDPLVRMPVRRPTAMAHGGFQRFGDVLLASHAVAVDEGAEQIAFLLDRLDLSGGEPQLAEPINVPGPVVSYDGKDRAVVVALELEVDGEMPEEECYGQPSAIDYDYDRGQCHLMHQSLARVELTGDSATVLDELTVEQEGESGLLGALAGEGVIFVHLGAGSFYGGFDDVPVGVPAGHLDYDRLVESSELLVLTMSGDALEITSRVDLHSDFGLDDARTSGDRLVLPTSGRGLTVLDASDPTSPTTEVHDLFGGYCRGVVLSGEMAYCALHEYGAQGWQL